MKKRLTCLAGLSLFASACVPTTDTEIGGTAGKGSSGEHGPKRETSTGGVLTKPDGLQVVQNTALSKATSAPWVGMVPATDPNVTSCAEGWSAIRMDDEDYYNFNKIYIWDAATGTSQTTRNNFSVGGLIHSSSPDRAGGNTWFKYCARYVPTLPRLSFDYSVISASNTCPANSYRFYRRFDNEDDSNHNRYSGDITPNSTSTNGGATVLNFCFVPKLDGGPSWDPLFDNQLVFAKQSVLSKSITFHTDDEDDENNNQWNAASGTSADYITRMKAAVSAGGNTDLVVTTAGALTTLDFGDKSDCGSLQTTPMGIICTYYQGGVRQCGPWQVPQAAFDIAKYMYCTF